MLLLLLLFSVQCLIWNLWRLCFNLQIKSFVTLGSACCSAAVSEVNCISFDLWITLISFQPFSLELCWPVLKLWVLVLLWGTLDKHFHIRWTFTLIYKGWNLYWIPAYSSLFKSYSPFFLCSLHTKHTPCECTDELTHFSTKNNGDTLTNPNISASKFGGSFLR